jgi:hypothetical protein
MSTNSPRRSDANRPPKYCRQREKAKGRKDRACVWVDGRKIMLGIYGSEDSRAKYLEVIGAANSSHAELYNSTSGPIGPLTDPTINEVLIKFLK